MSYKIIRLSTGEFLMADVEADTGDSLTLRDPVVLMVTKEAVGFAAFNPFGVDDTIVLNAQHVLYTTIPQDDLVAEYTRIFSRIQVASADIIH